MKATVMVFVSCEAPRCKVRTFVEAPLVPITHRRWPEPIAVDPMAVIALLEEDGWRCTRDGLWCPVDHMPSREEVLASTANPPPRKP